MSCMTEKAIPGKIWSLVTSSVDKHSDCHKGDIQHVKQASSCYLLVLPHRGEMKEEIATFTRRHLLNVLPQKIKPDLSVQAQWLFT